MVTYILWWILRWLTIGKQSRCREGVVICFPIVTWQLWFRRNRHFAFYSICESLTMAMVLCICTCDTQLWHFVLVTLLPTGRSRVSNKFSSRSQSKTSWPPLQWNICYCREFWWNNKQRVDSVYFETEIKRTERNKQFVMSKSTKVTKKRKRESTINHGRQQKFFLGGNVDILFIIFKLLSISVRSNIILYWANICFSEHDLFSMNYKLCELYNKYGILSNYEQNTQFIQIASCLPAVPLLWNVASAREWDFTAQQFSWSCVFAHVRENIADGAMQIDVRKTLYPFYTTKKMPTVTVTITKKRFVGSNSQVY